MIEDIAARRLSETEVIGHLEREGRIKIKTNQGKAGHIDVHVSHDQCDGVQLAIHGGWTKCIQAVFLILDGVAYDHIAIKLSDAYEKTPKSEQIRYWLPERIVNWTEKFLVYTKHQI